MLYVSCPGSTARPNPFVARQYMSSARRPQSRITLSSFDWEPAARQAPATVPSYTYSDSALDTTVCAREFDHCRNPQIVMRWVVTSASTSSTVASTCLDNSALPPETRTCNSMRPPLTACALLPSTPPLYVRSCAINRGICFVGRAAMEPTPELDMVVGDAM